MDEFRYATTEFVELARFGLYAERVAPHLAELEGVIDMDLPDIPVAKLRAAKAKSQAARMLPLWRKALLLEERD